MESEEEWKEEDCLLPKKDLTIKELEEIFRDIFWGKPKKKNAYGEEE